MPAKFDLTLLTVEAAEIFVADGLEVPCEDGKPSGVFRDGLQYIVHEDRKETDSE